MHETRVVLHEKHLGNYSAMCTKMWSRHSWCVWVQRIRISAYYSLLLFHGQVFSRQSYNTINNILHRRSANVGYSLLCIPRCSGKSVSNPCQSATVFKDKISQLRVSVSASPVNSPHYLPPAAIPPDFSVFLLLLFIHDCPNKPSSLDVLPTSSTVPTSWHLFTSLCLPQSILLFSTLPIHHPFTLSL